LALPPDPPAQLQRLPAGSSISSCDDSRLGHQQASHVGAGEVLHAAHGMLAAQASLWRRPIEIVRYGVPAIKTALSLARYGCSGQLDDSSECRLIPGSCGRYAADVSSSGGQFYNSAATAARMRLRRLGGCRVVISLLSPLWPRTLLRAPVQVHWSPVAGCSCPSVNNDTVPASSQPCQIMAACAGSPENCPAGGMHALYCETGHSSKTAALPCGGDPLHNSDSLFYLISCACRCISHVPARERLLFAFLSCSTLMVASDCWRLYHGHHH